MGMNIQELMDTETDMDRRKRKTRIAIENALLDLMQRKPLDSISISELAEHADINRKTFYNNYNTIEEAIEGINRKISVHIFDALPEKITIQNEIEIYNLLLSFTTTIEPHKAILRKMARTSNSLSFIEYFKDQILPYVEKNLDSYHIDPVVVPYVNNYLVNGLSSIYYHWFEDDRLDAKQIALLAYNLTISVVRLDNYKDIQSGKK